MAHFESVFPNGQSYEQNYYEPKPTHPDIDLQILKETKSEARREHGFWNWMIAIAILACVGFAGVMVYVYWHTGALPGELIYPWYGFWGSDMFFATQNKNKIENEHHKDYRQLLQNGYNQIYSGRS